MMTHVKKALIMAILCVALTGALCGCGEEEKHANGNNASTVPTSSVEASEVSYESSVETSSAPEESRKEPEESKPEESAEASGTGQPELKVEEDDPWRKEKIAIQEKVREILASEDFKSVDAVDGSMILREQLKDFLEEEEIDFSPTVDTASMYGMFSDGERLGFQFQQIYTAHDYETLAKRASNPKENEGLDKLLEIARKNAGDKTDYKNILGSIHDAVMMQEITDEHYFNDLDYRITWDGIRGSFRDGTKWGYSFEELKKPVESSAEE